MDSNFKDKLIDRLIDIILDYDNNKQFFTKKDILRLAILNMSDFESFKGKKWEE